MIPLNFPEAEFVLEGLEYGYGERLATSPLGFLLTLATDIGILASGLNPTNEDIYELYTTSTWHTHEGHRFEVMCREDGWYAVHESHEFSGPEVSPEDAIEQAYYLFDTGAWD